MKAKNPITIRIIRKGWLKKKYHAQIWHSNGNILFWTQKYDNLDDLEEMIENTQRHFATADLEYGL